MMKKILFLLPFLIILVVPLSSLAPTQGQPEPSPISIILVGDMVFDRGVAYMIGKYGNNDFRFPFLKIADYLREADIVFGNLEGPISDKGTKVGSIYSFRMDSKTIGALNFANVNVVSLANNHAFDYGRIAFEDTIIRLKKAGIEAAGIGAPVIKEIDGTKIAFLAYTAFGPSQISKDDFGAITEEIKITKQDADILIVSLHAGEEYQKTPTQFQIDFNKMAEEAGADVVVHHHPHIVQQGIYSLGNFIFDQGFSEETMQSQIIEVKIQDKKISEIVTKNIKINEFFQPEIK